MSDLTGPRAPKDKATLPRFRALDSGKTARFISNPLITPADFKSWQQFNGMTRAQFAKALGVSEMCVRRWRSGKVPVPQWLQDRRAAAFAR